MNTLAIRYFCQGAFQGACDASLSPGIVDKLCQEMFPQDEKGNYMKSDWLDLIAGFDKSDAKALGHQFACVLASVKRNSYYDALANLFRLLERAAKPSQDTHWRN